MRPFASGMHSVEVMADGDTRQKDQAGDDPTVLSAECERVVIGQHQKDNGQGEVVVVGRAQFGNLAIFRVGFAPRFEVGDDDALVGHDLEKDVARHDGGGEGPEV